MMTAPKSIYQLVEQFEQDKDKYKQSGYSESDVRAEFVDPLFEALGWNMRDSSQIKREGRVQIWGRVKHPDYSFMVGRGTAFYVETKKPSINLRDSATSALQLRAYGWSGNTDVGILTDFEEFVVYDCRVEPKADDSANVARVWLMTYEHYIEQWEELVKYFSRDAVQAGEHRAILESKPRGIFGVDAAFLRDMERWRETLAKDIAKRNPNLNQRELNLLVQRTIDRIVFLRIAEDRRIEPYGRLERTAGEGRRVYEQLKILFREADDKYNSGLFHFNPDAARASEADDLSMKIAVGSDPLRSIIRELYPWKSLYQFSVIPADILGQVYERFLGKVIELSEDGQAQVTDKPEVRKAGGVYYTPTYIVDYIVENTVGKLLKGKTPSQVAKLRILDPACGSGSFLTGAYQYLLDWHLDYYRQHPQRFRNRRRETTEGFVLTTAEKRRILLNNIYGVDLDQNAVEVSKLALLLKMLENESGATGLQTIMFSAGGQILPDLSSNIKWGNSLIGMDFYSGKQVDMFDEEEIYRIKAFDWESQASGFGEIMDGGGFDVVIGNPPYVRQEILGKAFKDYAKQRYETYAGTADLYTYFIEKGVKLLNENGLFGIIVANKWMRSRYGKPLRIWLKQRDIKKIIDFGDLQVFQDASTYPSILLIGNHVPSKTFSSTAVEHLTFSSLAEYVSRNSFNVRMNLLVDSGWALSSEKSQLLVKKLADLGTALADYVDKKIHFGIKTGLNKAFIVNEETKNELIEDNSDNSLFVKPLLRGRNIKRYENPVPNEYLILIPNGWTDSQRDCQDAWSYFSEHHSAIADYLSPFKQDAKKRADQGQYWWELRPCDYYAAFEKPKLMLPDISLRGNFILDTTGERYCINTAYIIGSADKYLLGILNSRLITFFYENVSAKYRAGYLRFIYQYLEVIPIRTIDFDKRRDVDMHDEMVTLVETMLDLHKQLPVLSGIRLDIVKARIESTDRQIDRLVYRLYGLTADEIAIVEG